MKTAAWFSLIVACFTLQTRAAEQCLVIGDSLSKEYKIEFPALYPQNRESWDTRNWIELLAARRAGFFDTGHQRIYPDFRLIGTKHNWAFPGATSQEIRSKLSSRALSHRLWQSELRQQLRGEVERVVIFAGGNDLEDLYPTLYRGQNSAAQLTRIRQNLLWIVDYVKAQRPSLQVVLVAVPHIGICPDIQREFPTDAVKTARVTAALDLLNAQLAASAKSRGVAFADGVYTFTRSTLTQPVFIGSTEILKAADADSRPQYLFSGDGFHPAGAGQFFIAQSILDAFRKRWPTPALQPLTAEEGLRALGL
jgi:lysophospholipase L1-like esterase